MRPAHTDNTYLELRKFVRDHGRFAVSLGDGGYDDAVAHLLGLGRGCMAHMCIRHSSQYAQGSRTLHHAWNSSHLLRGPVKKEAACAPAEALYELGTARGALFSVNNQPSSFIARVLGMFGMRMRLPGLNPHVLISVPT